jgi:hypothetical protein
MSYALRLTKLQAELLIPALRQIYINNINYEHAGFCRNSHPEAYPACPHFGSNDPEYMKLVLNLWERIRLLQKAGGRIYGLDAFGLAACIFAVRITMRKIRHGHHEAWSPRLTTAADHLITRLEHERKRLKRAMIAEQGEAVYQAKAQRWTSFHRYLHYHYVYCSCSYRPQRNIFRARRLRIDQFVRWTQEALIARGEAVPSNLRALVSLFLRYVRRGRATCDFRRLHNDPTYAKHFFSAYVLHRYIPK